MANDGGRIGVTELLVGVPFPALAFEIMRHATPPYFLTETILSGATFLPEAAVHRGWVNELAEPNELVEDAIAVARELALLSPPAFAQTKLQLRAAVTERMARSREATDKVVTEIWAGSDTLRCIRNYVARKLKKN